MKRMAWIEKLILVLLPCLLVGLSGCGSETTVSSGAQSTSSAVAGGASTPVALTARTLTGAWLGEAILDEEKFQEQISQLDAETQKRVKLQAKSFLTTAVAMEFRENGTVQNEVELVSIHGKLLHDGSFGSWQVLESRPNGMLVQLQERSSNGEVSTVKNFYQFSQDRNQMAIKIQVSKELATCDAMVVFDRKSLPPVNVAAGDTGTINK